MKENVRNEWKPTKKDEIDIHDVEWSKSDFLQSKHLQLTKSRNVF